MGLAGEISDRIEAEKDEGYSLASFVTDEVLGKETTLIHLPHFLFCERKSGVPNFSLQHRA